MLLSSLVALTVVLAGCDSNFGAQRAVTDQGHDILDLWQGAVAVALGIFAVVAGLLVWVLVRYRRRGRDDIPSQRQYVVPIEVLYTVLPILIVAGLFGFSYATQDKVDALTKHPSVTIDVRGFQWQWRFHYVGKDVTVTGLPSRPAVMVVPVGETVRLNLESRDVVHSFFVPDFLYKRDLIPGVHNKVDIRVVDAGKYQGYCAEFCGLDHARMTFEVRAVSPSRFQAWLDAHRGELIGGDTGTGSAS
jgi:cytochrome c oxidase subunit II